MKALGEVSGYFLEQGLNKLARRWLEKQAFIPLDVYMRAEG